MLSVNTGSTPKRHGWLLNGEAIKHYAERGFPISLLQPPAKENSPITPSKPPVENTYYGTIMGVLYSDNYMDGTNLSSDEMPSPEPTCIGGTLYVTNYRVVFKQGEDKILFSAPLTSIIKAEARYPGDHNMINDEIPYDFLSRSKGCLFIRTKDLQVARMFFHSDSSETVTDTVKSINHYAPKDINQVFAFVSSQNSHFTPEQRANGWCNYLLAEYERLGINNDCAWRVTNINEDYKFCDTYPNMLVVPKSFSDDDLRIVAGFRSRARIPALTWRHKTSGAIITRSSQPMVGITRARSKQDEDLLEHIRRATKQSQLNIIDCRPRANALANTVMGKGYENTAYYPQCSISFMGIDHIHTMNQSLQMLSRLCHTEGSLNKANLEACGWLNHTKAIMSAANKVVQSIERYQGVLIHCSDGWDRTAQVSALAQVLLDPYYRTIHGFRVLIEKEFVSFGHKFLDRMCHVPPSGASESSPIFVQFVDCVFQVWQQCPSYFEFNELFLITLLDHSYSCLYGNFLYNCERERESAKVQSNTISIWSHVQERLDLYVNIWYGRHSTVRRLQYDRNLYNTMTMGSPRPLDMSEIGEEVDPNSFTVVLSPDCSLDMLASNFWTGYYTRYSTSMKSTYRDLIHSELEECKMEIEKLKKEKKEKEKETNRLTSKIKKYKEEIKKRDAELQKYETIRDEEHNHDCILVNATPDEEINRTVMKNIDESGIVFEDYFKV
ncbi:myotubularin [Acrasis kona]|uniref:Myotubularin n=1 Tax=Acrasis kona TaxID=1008807 RepID=A0AAW2ZPB2_9EUKA